MVSLNTYNTHHQALQITKKSKAQFKGTVFIIRMTQFDE